MQVFYTKIDKLCCLILMHNFNHQAKWKIHTDLSFHFKHCARIAEVKNLFKCKTAELTGFTGLVDSQGKFYIVRQEQARNYNAANSN